MGTPCSRSPSPFFDQDTTSTCDFCNRVFSDTKKSGCSCQICDKCANDICPLCHFQKNEPIAFAQSFDAPKNGTKTITGPFFELEAAFFGGFLLYLHLLKCDRNARLLMTWAGQEQTLLLYRHRRPYDIAPILAHRTPGKSFTVALVPPNLNAPHLQGSYCNWRLFHEMYPFTLDRPETARIEALPDTDQLLLQHIFALPHKNQRIWAVKSRFPKYDRLFFASSGHHNLSCLLCGRVFTSLLALARSCLGYPHLTNDNDLDTALLVTITFEENEVRAKADTAMGNMVHFVDYWSNLKSIEPAKPRPQFFSALYDIAFPPNMLPESAVKLTNQLLNSTAMRIPVFIVYDIQYDDEFAVKAKIWMCRPITENLPSTITLDCMLDKFHSLLFQGLFRIIVKESKPVPGFFGQIYYWRDNYQAASASKTAAQTHSDAKQ